MLVVFSTLIFFARQITVTGYDCDRIPPGGVCINDQLPFSNELLEGTPSECCKLALFDEEDLDICGFNNEEVDTDIKNEQIPKDAECEGQHCLLERYDVAYENGLINQPALVEFLDSFAENNSTYKPAVALAKKNCVRRKFENQPFDSCRAKTLLVCITTSMYLECPAWKNSTSCNMLKIHTKFCKPDNVDRYL